ncbi:MAG: hypothetical protein IPJ77_05935 [Planctomycetes bacterium]|nr:hypothetical protein [Planctomycetota bacterium]
MKLASSSDIHAFAVGWVMPQSAASPARLVMCPARPAHSFKKVWNVSRSVTFKIRRTSRSMYVRTSSVSHRGESSYRSWMRG